MSQRFPTTHSIRRGNDWLAIVKILVLLGLVFLVLVPSSSHGSESFTQVSPASSTPNFSISTNPTSLTIAAGSSQTSQVNLASQNGFAGTVYLSASSYPLDVSLSTTSVTLSSGGTGSSTLTVAVPSSTTPGSYSAFVEATGGCSLTGFSDVSVTVTGPDFTISAEQTHLTLAQGTSSTSKIDLASKNGFSGTLTLSAFGITPSPTLSSPSVVLTPGGTGTSTLTVAPDTSTEPGNYTVSVDASASLFFSHSVSILVTVTGPTFTLGVSQEFLTLVPGGASNSSTVTVTSVGGFTGTVSLVDSVFPTGLTHGLSPTSVIDSGTSTYTVSAPLGTKLGTYYAGIDGTSGSHAKSAFVIITVKGPDFELSANPFSVTILAGNSCTSTITASSIDQFSGTIGLTHKEPAGLTLSFASTSVTLPGSSSTTLTITAASTMLPGFYSVDVNGTSNTLTHTITVDVVIIGPDFSLSANPSSLTVTAGGSSVTSTITVTAENGFTGAVSLTASPFETGVTALISPSSITGSGTATLTVSAASGTPPAPDDTVEVIGTSGSLTHTTYISITVNGPDFTLSVNPSPVTFNAGTPTTATVTVNPTNGFTDPVDLFAYPSFNLNASITPSTVTSGSYSATLSLNSTIPGSYTVEIDASSGAFFKTASLSVTVFGPDFTLSASPNSLTITAGASQTSTITVNPVHGFNSAVDLTAPSPPTGITASFLPTPISPPTTSTVTISVDVTVTPGTYSVTVHGTSGNLAHDTTITVNVAGFTLSTNPGSLTIAEGASKTSTATVAAQNGFTGTVSLTTSTPSGLTATPNPNSIINSGTSQLTITASNSISPGTYTVNVTGASGALTQTSTISVTVPVPDFSVLPSSPTTTPCTVSTKCGTTIDITYLNGFSGTVSLSSSASTPAGLTCDPLTPTSVSASGTATLSCESTATGTYGVTVTGTSGSLSHSTATITYGVVPPQDFSITAGAVSPSTILAGNSGTSAITVTDLGGFTGTVSFSVSTSTPAGLVCTTPGASPTESSLSCYANTSGDYTVKVTGTATISGTPTSHDTSTILFHVVDFSISAGSVSPSPLLAGAQGTSTVTITPLNGFAGTVDFTISHPSGLTCGTKSPASSGSYSSTLSCTASSGGDYTVTVTGSSDSLSRTTGSIVFHVEGFTISASTPGAVNTGQSTVSTVTISPVNGFTGTVQLSDNPIPSGLTCTALSQTSVTLSSSSVTSTLSCSSQSGGAYTVTVTGTSSGLTLHSTATFTIHAPDLMLTSTTPLSVNTGQLANATITVTPVYGFTGTATLTVSSSPSGLSCSFDHPTIQGSGSAVLSCNSSTANDYSVTVTATGGASPHTTVITVHVAAPPSQSSSATILGLQPLIFYGIVGLIVAIVAAGAALLFRRRGA